MRPICRRPGTAHNDNAYCCNDAEKAERRISGVRFLPSRRIDAVTAVTAITAFYGVLLSASRANRTTEGRDSSNGHAVVKRAPPACLLRTTADGAWLYVDRRLTVSFSELGSSRFDSVFFFYSTIRFPLTFFFFNTLTALKRSCWFIFRECACARSLHFSPIKTRSARRVNKP